MLNNQYRQIFITESDINCCFLCLKPVKYYFAFECGCYNFIHTKCIQGKNINQCIICRKNINLSIINYNNNNDDDIIYKIFYDIRFMNYFNLILLSMINLIKNIDNNIFSFALFITINFLVVFGLFVPVYIINIFANIVYYLSCQMVSIFYDFINDLSDCLTI